MKKKIISISLTLFILLSSFTPFSVYAKTLVYEDGKEIYQMAIDCGFANCGIIPLSDLDGYEFRVEERMNKTVNVFEVNLSIYVHS